MDQKDTETSVQEAIAKGCKVNLYATVSLELINFPVIPFM